ncbi:putative bifunctional diguanylate cyclase/phosphodiesterase [Pelosinus sp. sgz500959]|uniref:putative bifunctional diguanylate cyclase/phosphodiesterase n=1 Tax=Pelosinus sp. sgz500959 TaxID=3242472 RepID=UPI0036712872
MEKQLTRSIVKKHLWMGIFFGMLFPVIAILFELYRLEIAYTIENIKSIHLNNKLLFMIDTVPIFMGILFYRNGVSRWHIEVVNQQFENLVVTDEISGINNRRYGKRKLSEMIVSAKNHGGRIGVIFIDLDRFKTFNDNMGHWFGDKLLQVVANRLKGELQTGEFIARLGSDEFMILIENPSTMEDLHTVAGRYVELFKQSFLVIDKHYTIHASMGISVFPNNGDDMETLFRNADIALYINKRSKNNQYEIFHDSMLANVNRTFIMEKELWGALERGEFSLVYQPLVDAYSGKISGAEALLRWNNPLLGVVSPIDFIPVAESTNLIVKIGKWVLKEACSQNKRWQEQGMTPIEISVNVSAKQLRYPDFIDAVKNIIEEIGMNSHHLKLEITESVSMENIDEVRKIFRELKQMNIKLSIDDFGTGYSSLAELKALAVDEIKIDKSFIDDIHISGNINDMVMIESIVAMAKSFKLKVVAEGVESGDQFSILQDAQCDYVQGYFFSKPVKAEDFVQVFEKLGGELILK